jgi:hypothetical protein
MQPPSQRCRTKRSTQAAGSVDTYINIKRGGWVTAVFRSDPTSQAKTQRRKDAKKIVISEWFAALLIPSEKDDRSLARRFSAQSLYDHGLHSIGLSHDPICVRMRSLLLYDAFGFLPLRLCVTTRPFHPQRSESELLTPPLGVWYHPGWDNPDRTTRCTQALGRLR